MREDVRMSKATKGRSMNQWPTHILINEQKEKTHIMTRSRGMRHVTTHKATEGRSSINGRPTHRRNEQKEKTHSPAALSSPKKDVEFFFTERRELGDSNRA
jgi:hypothetical protein